LDPPSKLKDAIKRMIPKIDIHIVNNIIDSIYQISDTRKEYLKKSIGLRYGMILTPALKRTLKDFK